MQFSTVFTALVAVSSASAVNIVKARQNGTDPIGLIAVYNNAQCDGESHETFMLESLGDCHTFEQGYGSAYLSPTHSLGEHFLVTFKGKDCTGNVQVAPASTCAINLSDDAIWSVGAMPAPELPFSS